MFKQAGPFNRHVPDIVYCSQIQSEGTGTSLHSTAKHGLRVAYISAAAHPCLVSDSEWFS